MAAHFPAARVLGIDYHDVSVTHARKAAAEAGLSERARFEVAAATDLPGAGYTLITFFDSLHDLGDPIGALAHLQLGRVFVISGDQIKAKAAYKAFLAVWLLGTN